MRASPDWRRAFLVGLESLSQNCDSLSPCKCAMPVSRVGAQSCAPAGRHEYLVTYRHIGFRLTRVKYV